LIIAGGLNWGNPRSKRQWNSGIVANVATISPARPFCIDLVDGSKPEDKQFDEWQKEHLSEEGRARSCNDIQLEKSHGFVPDASHNISRQTGEGLVPEEELTWSS
jgi:hypothetical protein